MSLFDFFRKKKELKKRADENFDELYKLYNAKKYDEIITIVANRYQNEQLSLEVKKLLVLTYYYKKEYAKSLELAQEIALVLDDVTSWFNVLSALMALNQPQQGEEIFNKILKMHKGVKSTGKGANFIPQLCIPFIRYNYANMLIEIGLFADALSQLETLADIYCNVKITDATFLYIRGIPFFDGYLNSIKKANEGLNLDICQSDIVKKLLSSIDDDGKSYIKENILKAN